MTEIRHTCLEHGTFYDTDKWAFKSEAWQECNFAHVNLNKIHRQSDFEFIHILEKCRLGKPMRADHRDLLLDHKSDTKDAVRLFPTRDKVKELNTKEFARLTSPIQIFGCYDDFEWNKEHGNLRFKEQRDPDGHLRALEEHRLKGSLQMRKGMLVILLVNLDLQIGPVNGSQGVVVDFVKSADECPPEQTGDYQEYKARRIADFVTHNHKNKVWPIVRFTNGVKRTIFAHCTVNELADTIPYSLLSRTQIPLIAAWAMTVHKSQGMTLSKVVVDLSGSFEARQEYVALSRARSLEGLKVLSLGSSDRRGNAQVMEFLRDNFGLY